MRRYHALALVLLLASDAACNSSPALNAFFSELDNNHDGSIDVNEASKFIGVSIGGQEFDEPQEAAEAAASFLTSIDGGDVGNTVSVDELDIHLHNVLNGVRVWEWVRHALGLPHYSEAFRRHSITPLDFPVLVQEDGRVLEEEFGVASSFHRVKLVRAIRLQILGLGATPSEPQLLACNATPPVYAPLYGGGGGPSGGGGSASGGRVAVRWSPPANPGRPPLHRYVLEGASADGRWRPLAEVDDAQPAAVVLDWGAAAEGGAGGGGGGEGFEAEVGEPAAGGGGRSLLLRVSAWNLYGRSPYATAACEMPSPVAAAAEAADIAPPPGYFALRNGTGSGPAPSRPSGTVGAVTLTSLPGAEQPSCSQGEGQLLPPVHQPAGKQLHAGSSGSGVAAGGGGSGSGSSGEAGGSRWWSSLLVLVLPWLLRLLPLPVLQRAAEAVQGLLLRGFAAAGRRPPDWLLLPPPPLPPSGPRGTPLMGLSSGRPGGAEATSAADPPGAAAVTSAPVAAASGGVWREGAALAGMTTVAATIAAAAPIAVPNARGVQPYPRSAAAAAAVGPAAMAAAAQAGFSSSPPEAGMLYAGSSGGVGVGGGGSPGFLTRVLTGGLGSPPRPSAPLPVPRPAGTSAAPHRSSSEGELAGGDHSQPRLLLAHGHPGSYPSLADAAFARSAPSTSASTLLAASAPHRLPHVRSADRLLAVPGGSATYSGGGGGSGVANGGIGLDAMGDAEAVEALELAAAAATGACCSSSSAPAAGWVAARDRNRMCAIPGCGRKLDLRHFREYSRKHYCGRCQQTVCLAHTAYSPHGATGSCGHESRCVCVVCFTHFNTAYQQFLRQRNTLPPTAPVAAARQGAGASSGLGSEGVQLVRAGTAAGQQLEAGADKSAAKLLWERAATKLKAVTRFRKKGGDGQKSVAARAARGPPSMEPVAE